MKFASPAGPDGPCQAACWPPWAPSWPGRLSAPPRPARPCPRARPPSCWLPWPGAPDRCPPLTGTVVESAASACPTCRGERLTRSLTSLLTGSHTVRIWYADASHFRLAVPGMESESRSHRERRTAWYWQSSTNSVDPLLCCPRRAPPARQARDARHHPAAGRPAGPGRGRARHRVTVQSNVRWPARRPTSWCSRPGAPDSLVGQVRIAIDAAHNVPLRVQIFARRASSPAFQVGLHFDLVRAARRLELRLHPAAAAKVRRPRSAAGWSGPGAPRTARVRPRCIGKDWLAVAVLPARALSEARRVWRLTGGVAGSAAQSPSSATPGGSAGEHRRVRAAVGRAAALGQATCRVPGGADGCCTPACCPC